MGKIMLDENTDKLLRNTSMAKKKEEATVAAKEEIKTQTLREMALKSELERVNAALPARQGQLAAASERAAARCAQHVNKHWSKSGGVWPSAFGENQGARSS